MWHLSFMVKSSAQTSWQTDRQTHTHTHKHTRWKHYHLAIAGDNNLELEYVVLSSCWQTHMTSPLRTLYNYEHCQCVVVFCCGLMYIYFTHVLQGCCTSTEGIRLLKCKRNNPVKHVQNIMQSRWWLLWHSYSKTNCKPVYLCHSSSNPR